MRTRNAIERLTVAGRPLLSDADALVGGAEKERILERIVASDRLMPSGHRRRGLAFGLAFGVILAGAAVVAASGVLDNSSATKAGGHDQAALTGAPIELAGYHFRTPAGFKTTSEPACGEQGPNPAVDGFNAAASADGGCVSVGFLRAVGNATGLKATPAGRPVAVGSYPGYFDAQTDSSQSVLYVALPKTDLNPQTYLMLSSDGLTEDELIAVAKSGLADIPFAPTTTTGTEGSS